MFIFFILSGSHVFAGGVEGFVASEEGPVEFATVSIQDQNLGAVTDADGWFSINNLPQGNYTLVVNSLGFKNLQIEFELREDELKNLGQIYITKDILGLEEVVVTGTRSQISRYQSPVIINTISNRTFEATQSLSIAEGLNFSPGLRVENNCQNCGFTQLRMNGLDGAYSQVLINSRPVFSALAGVYGLEMLPANMVEKVEIVRGGGSVLFGGNAVAGTVNIITKDPMENSFEVGLNQSFVGLETSDRTINFNASVVSEKMDKGITFFGFNRTRSPWDANDDGFSEIVKLRNNTFGFDAFWDINDRAKLKLGAYYINEFRRGGNKFDLFPHQTDVTEQLEHDILSGNISFEQYSKDFKHKVSVYGSLQMVNRDSYYGGGGRVIQEGDTLTPDDILAINAYGNSNDISVVGGLQYNYEISKKLLLIAGAEYIYNDVRDEMPGYARKISQQVGTLGSYAQLEFKPTKNLTLLAGGRFDHVRIDGIYDLDMDRFENERNLNVMVPRLSAMYQLTEDLKLRASFAQGYRAPQAFDEDLHIETVGGSARFIRLDTALVSERSNSGMLSLNYDKVIKNWQMNFVLEGFYTKLNNPFILVDQTELPSGVAVITKENGSGATVAGVNFEGNVAFGSKLVIQSGATIQMANYAAEEEIWAPEDPADDTPPTVTKKLLRTPDAYGYFSLVYQPVPAVSIAYSGVITGSMDVAHVIDPDTELTVIEQTPIFFENNLKVAYTFRLKEDFRINLFAGMQNLFDSYQNDFDIGADRDAGYVYGPVRPRTIFMGLKFGLN